MGFYGGGPPLDTLRESEEEVSEGPTTEELSLLHAIYAEHGTNPFSFRNRDNKSIGWDLVAAGYLTYLGLRRDMGGVRDVFRLSRLGLEALRRYGYRGAARRRLPGLVGVRHDSGNPILPKYRLG